MWSLVDTSWRPLAFASFIVAVLVFLTLKVKTPGFEAIRPLHYTGIFALFIGSLYFLPTLLKSVIDLQLHRSARIIVAWLGLLYLYILLATLTMPIRAFKDFVIGSSVDLGCLLVVSGYLLWGRGQRRDPARLIAASVLVFATVSAVIAWLMYFDLFSLNVLGLEIAQNSAWGARIHGLLGEPTHMGAAVGIGIVVGLHFLARAESRRFSILIIGSLVVLGAALYGTGSRNALLSTTIAIVAMLVFMARSRRRVCAGTLAAFAGGFLLMTAMISAIPPNPNIAAATTIGGGAPGVARAREHLEYAFRLNDSAGAMRRLVIIREVADIYAQQSMTEQILGGGYGSLQRVYGSALNDYLESLVDFGAIFVALLLGYFLYLGVFLILMARRGDDARRHQMVLALALLAFSGSFAANLSSLFPEFFHLANFAHILAVAFTLVVGHGHPVTVES